jgi:iron complex transport system substrate-binding protein
LYENLSLVGRLTGHEAEAAQLADALAARVAAVADAVKGATTRPKVFYEIDASDPTKPWTTGPGTFMDTFIALAGGENVGAALSDAYAQISSEALVSQNPDIILLGDAAYGVTAESVGQRAGWEDLAAVKAGQVYPFDDNLASRPGPRLVDGLEALAGILHPELFN